MAAITNGDADGRTSSAVLEEVWHLELSGRVHGLDALAARAHTMLGPLLPVTDEAFRRALGLDAPSLGANDRLHLATRAALLKRLTRDATISRPDASIRAPEYALTQRIALESDAREADHCSYEHATPCRTPNH
jgi:predicted nucleic acid-binding protein